MKQMKKMILLFFAVLIIHTASNAQKFNLAINYNAAVPVSSSFKEYVSKTSYRGFQASALYNLSTQIRIGLQVSYNDFYEKYPRQVYKTTDGADISTVITNTMQTIPVLVKGEFSPVKNGWIKPYVGLGAGLNFINYDQYLGEFQFNKYYIKPGFSGDAGLLVPFSKTSHYGFRLSTSYNITPFKEEGIDNVNTWNVQAGVVIPLK